MIYYPFQLIGHAASWAFVMPVPMRFISRTLRAIAGTFAMANVMERLRSTPHLCYFFIGRLHVFTGAYVLRLRFLNGTCNVSIPVCFYRSVVAGGL